MAIKTTSISLDDFMQMYSDEGPFEWIDGEMIPVPPQVVRGSRVVMRLGRLLADYAEATRLGETFFKLPFVITVPRKENWIEGSRVPDIIFVSASRLAEVAATDPDWQDKPITIVPDLAIAIVSPIDQFSAVVKKVERYLEDGVRQAWIVNPDNQIVIIYEQGKHQQTRLTGEMILSGGNILPGFEIPVSKLFK